MSESEKIQNKKLLKLMEQLKQNKTLLSMRLVGQGYNQLTIITDIRKNKKASFFVIDMPRNFMDAVAEIAVWKIHFEFNGLDNLKHIFTTSGGKFFGKEIQIPFPDYVERFQRRRHFRISVPFGTKLFFMSGEVQWGINLINISLSGTLGSLSRLTKKDNKELILKKGDSLKNIEIVVSSDKERSERKVKIKESVVRRAEHDWQKGLDYYAFEFLDIRRGEKKTLTKIIYDFQRLSLQRKFPLYNGDLNR
jgi:hypothetical protein